MSSASLEFNRTSLVGCRAEVVTRKYLQPCLNWSCPCISRAVDRRVHDQGSIGSVQRRRDRYHHHDHGAGVENTAGRRPEGIVAAAAVVPQLCPQFYLCRHLLEQPPPHASCLYRGERSNPLGQPAPVVL